MTIYALVKMAIRTTICSGIAAYVISYLQGFKDNEKATNLDEVSFRTSSFFNIASVIVIMILGVFYATWW